MSKAVKLAPMGKAKPQHKVQSKFPVKTSNRTNTMGIGRMKNKVPLVSNGAVKQGTKNATRPVKAPVVVVRKPQAKSVIAKKSPIKKGTKGGNGSRPKKVYGL